METTSNTSTTGYWIRQQVRVVVAGTRYLVDTDGQVRTWDEVAGHYSVHPRLHPSTIRAAQEAANDALRIS